MNRDALLREIGLAPLWRLRSRVRDADADVSRPAIDESKQARLSTGADAQSTAPARAPATHADPQPSCAPASSDGRAAVIAGLEWEALEQAIRSCTACRLCEQRKQAVPGVGDRRATWMFVGEGPGAEEDRRGEPFVGQAGKLLDAMLAAIGLRRGEGVYIANAVKCRPPHNRTPEPDEIAACLPFLQRQIALVRPRVLVALGRPAAQALLGAEVRISTARGKVHAHSGFPVIVTYHPAYLLRNPVDKGKAWEDLCHARTLGAAEGGLTARDNGPS
ncbi:MAG: uracil-DNA glycosylase [Rhodocyclales bacterium]|nr:uracil-DNA glycosylase [Rhodocyclales bacterium]